MKFKVIGTQVTLSINDHPDHFKSHSLLCRQGFKLSARSDGDVGDIDGAFWETDGVGVRPDVQLAIVFHHDLVNSNKRSIKLRPHISHGYSARDFQSAVSIFDKTINRISFWFVNMLRHTKYLFSITDLLHKFDSFKKT